MNSNQSATFVPGDVVACRFPFAEQPHCPGEKVRPCLVLAVHQRRDGAVFAEVAYGTDAAHTSNSGFDFTIDHEAEYLRAGLKKPTRFVLARSLMVPMTAEYLDFNHAGSATIGSLPPESRQRMNERQRTRTECRRPNGVEVCYRPKKKIILRTAACRTGR